MASRKAEGSAVSPELLQTLAEALRAASQAQQTMAEAMLALASRSAAIWGAIPRIRANSVSEAAVEFPHVGTVELIGDELAFVENLPGEFQRTFAQLAAHEKKVRLELDLAQLLGAGLQAQSDGFISSLTSFVSQQSDYKIVSAAQCDTD